MNLWANIEPGDLLPGEIVHISKKSGVSILPADYGLKPMYKQGNVSKWLKLDGQEVIGGKLYLTNYRLLFKSYPTSRLKGKFSVFLHTIISGEDTSRGIKNKITVKTESQNFDFIVWGIQEFLFSLNAAKKLQTAEEFQQLSIIIQNNLNIVAEGLGYSKAADVASRSMGNMVEIAKDPFSLVSLMNVLAIILKSTDTPKKD